MGLKERVKINANLRLFRQSNVSGSHRGCVRLSKNNHYIHEYAKFKKAWSLLQDGKEFLTEGIFENGSRADVIDLTEGVVYEILFSEKEENILLKKEVYPLPIVAIKVSVVKQ